MFWDFEHPYSKNLESRDLDSKEDLEILEVWIFKRTWRFLKFGYLRKPGDF